MAGPEARGSQTGGHAISAVRGGICEVEQEAGCVRKLFHIGTLEGAIMKQIRE